MSPRTSKNCLQHEPKKIAFKPESGQGLKPLTVLLLAFYVEGIVQGLCPQQHIPADEPCLPTTASLLQRVNHQKVCPSRESAIRNCCRDVEVFWKRFTCDPCSSLLANSRVANLCCLFVLNAVQHI